MPTLVTLIDSTIPVASDFNNNYTALNQAIGTGTTITTYTAGDTLYASAANTLSKLPIGSSGNILTVSSGLPAWAVGLTSATSQAASGASVTFSSIPASVKRITITFDGVSASGTDNILVQIGDSGGLETTVYVSGAGGAANAGSYVTVTSTAGFIVYNPVAANAFYGHMVITRRDSNSWVASHSMMSTDRTSHGGGNKTLSAELDRVAILFTGANTFDAGNFNIMYEVS